MQLLTLVPKSWRPFLDGCEDALEKISQHLQEDEYQPPAPLIFRALQSLPPEDVRCVILGQDPYPTPGVPVGLSFSVGPNDKIPASLKNIFKEYEDDLGLPAPSSGDLTPWTAHTLLLNTCLTCRPGQAGSHARIGWQMITTALLTGLVTVNPHVVFICWGGPALKVVQSLPGEHQVVASAHPSPLAAYRGFFGSRPFSKANEELSEMGLEAVNWKL
jgi:uracil-DNA glycosylase